MIEINKEECINCGVCISVCPEGFEYIEGLIKLINGKAKGMGEAISVCPVGAIE